LEATLFFVLSVKSEFTLGQNVQETVLQWIFEILDNTSLNSEPAILLHKTVLNFFGQNPENLTDLVPYSRSLELFDLSLRALQACSAATQVPDLSASAARAINKIVRSLRIDELPLTDLVNGLLYLLTGNIDIVHKLTIVEGYTFLFASRLDKEAIPSLISSILEPIVSVNVQHCDSAVALSVLKIVFTVGKTLYTTAPGKLEADSWINGKGKEMSEWVRFNVKVFVHRFADDFEVMEVSSIRPSLI